MAGCSDHFFLFPQGCAAETLAAPNDKGHVAVRDRQGYPGDKRAV